MCSVSKDAPQSARSLRILAASATVWLGLSGGGPAQAALPGENGKLVYAAQQASSPTDIWLANPDGSARENLTRSPGIGEAAPSAGPRGRLVAYSRRAGGDLDIFVVPADGSAPARNLTRRARGNDHSPSFGPDGRIAFVSDRAGSEDVFIMGRRGRHATNLTPGSAATDTEPSVSGRGDLIAFASDRDGDFDIYTISLLPGGGTVNLTAGAPQRDTEPVFSADGETIAFFSPRGGYYDGSVDLWAMSSTGTELEELVDYGEGLGGPVGYAAGFSPDGDQLVTGEDGHGPNPYLAITDLRTGESHSLPAEMGTRMFDPEWAPAR